jgi:hypothetical protein
VGRNGFDSRYILDMSPPGPECQGVDPEFKQARNAPGPNSLRFTGSAKPGRRIRPPNYPLRIRIHGIQVPPITSEELAVARYRVFRGNEAQGQLSTYLYGVGLKD